VLFHNRCVSLISGAEIVPVHGKDVRGSVSCTFPENTHSTINTSAYSADGSTEMTR